MSLQPNTAALDEFNAQLARYLVWSRKGQGATIEDRARKIRFALYREFRAIAKSASALRAEIAGLDYAIERRADPSTGKPISTAAEIKARVSSLRFLSVSFLFATWKTSRQGQTGRFSATTRAQQRIGEAIVKTAPNRENPSVSLTSFLAGAIAQNRERHLVDNALRGQSADMGVYLKRKHDEHLRAAFGRTLGAITLAV